MRPRAPSQRRWPPSCPAACGSLTSHVYSSLCTFAQAVPSVWDAFPHLVCLESTSRLHGAQRKPPALLGPPSLSSAAFAADLGFARITPRGKQHVCWVSVHCSIPGAQTQSSLGYATWQAPSESHSTITSPLGALRQPLFLSLSLPELTEPGTWFILVLKVPTKGPCPIHPESVDTEERPLQVFKITFYYSLINTFFFFFN